MVSPEGWIDDNHIHGLDKSSATRSLFGYGHWAFTIPRGRPPTAIRSDKGVEGVNTIFISQWSVNTIVPQVIRSICLFNQITTSIVIYIHMNIENGIILLTMKPMIIHAAYHETKSNKRAKRTISAKEGGVEPSSGTRPRRTISIKRILRPKRPAPSTLRDDTSASGRQGYHQRDNQEIWGQSCNLLSGCRDLRPQRPYWLCPKKTGTEKSTQVYGRDHRFYQAATFTEIRCDMERPHSRCTRRIWCYPASSYHRERTCPKKKKGDNPERSIVVIGSKDSMTLIEHYEYLRTSTIQHDNELITTGYGLFMLRGMLGWIETVSVLEPTPDEETVNIGIKAPSEFSKIPSENCRSVVYILANMVISCMGGCL